MNVKIWIGLLTPYDQLRQFRQKLSKSCFWVLNSFPEWHYFVIHTWSYIEFFRVHILWNFSVSLDWINKEFLLADIGVRVASSLSSRLVSHSFYWIVISCQTSFKTWLIPRKSNLDISPLIAVQRERIRFLCTAIKGDVSKFDLFVWWVLLIYCNNLTLYYNIWILTICDIAGFAFTALTYLRLGMKEECEGLASLFWQTNILINIFFWENTRGYRFLQKMHTNIWPIDA